eukprot:TRINITY_DN7592_c0_g1_i1.p2 TRINITY_DN7592_c0_g1~~TRINITY_DN7592_c0_g1_i1.p2  ORF type:complete len:240 (+),score=79.86 TRINITY_DN7592_c0_g1_i1:25-720(+)
MAEAEAEAFAAAAQRAGALPASTSSEDKLALYALYKQASVGPCTTSRPAFYELVGRAKWDAWHRLGAMPKAEATAAYIDLANKLAPAPPAGGVETPASGQRQAANPSWTVFSRPQGDDADECAPVHRYARDGDLEHLKQVLDSGSVHVDDTDAEGRTPLLWAADSGHADVVRELLKRGANVNHQDNEGQSALHYAVTCGEAEVKQLLLENGIDTSLKDADGATALQLSSLS